MTMARISLFGWEKLKFINFRIDFLERARTTQRLDCAQRRPHQ